MTKLAAKLQMLRHSDKGATAVEYGLLVVLIAAVIIGVVTLIGTDVLEGFQTVEDSLGGNDG